MAKTPILLSTAALALRRTRIGTRLSSHVYQTDLESDLAPVGMLDQSCQRGLFYVGIEVDRACYDDPCTGGVFGILGVARPEGQVLPTQMSHAQRRSRERVLLSVTRSSSCF